MALSDAAVRGAKATGKAYTIGDYDGLSLSVKAGGSKSWFFRYVWAGKQRRMSLGTYPEISLREVRIARDDCRTLLAAQVNPQRERKRQTPVDHARRSALYSSPHQSYLTRDKALADLFDYIERFHNPRMRRRVGRQDLKISALFKPSMDMG